MASSDQKRRKRFIAGATCPQCGAVDKIFVATLDDKTWRGCSRCEFEEQLDDSSPEPSPTGVQVIKLLD